MTVISVLGAKMYLKILRAVRFKKPWTLMPTLPWDKKYGIGRAGLRENQKKVTDAFEKAARATAQMALSDRMTIIGAAMRGKSYGGEKRVIYAKLSPDLLKAKIEAVKAMV